MEHELEGVEMKKILLTGFEPFGGEAINPSLELINRLQAESWNQLQVHTLKLPVVFGKAIEKLRVAVLEVDPDIVIGVGQAGGRTALSIERVAINVNDAPIADNEGNQPIDQMINSRGQVAHFSTLPVKKMMQAAQEAGVPAVVSNSAGTYVCNHLMYGILDLLKGTKKLGGFIHIPFLPAQVVKKPTYASMALETMLRGLKAIIEALRTGAQEEELVGGRLD